MVSAYRRRPLQRLWRNVSILAGFALLLDLWVSLIQYKTFTRNLQIQTVTRITDLPMRARNQKIFIAAQFWSGASVLAGHWGTALGTLIDTLGADNVYISLLASGSLDNTIEVIQSLNETVLEPRNVARSIITDPSTHQDEIDQGPLDEQGHPKEGWIKTSRAETTSQKELRRIPYLSKLRNKTLEPLKTQLAQGIQYDKILHLNDVMFQPSDVLSLLATNEGVYDVACAFDFQHPPSFYDTFALRDSKGNPAGSSYFPFYRSSESRSAILQARPTPVKSCWNGMVMADATAYYASDIVRHSGTQTEVVQGLTFRGLPDSLAQHHLEASECCLIHADLMSRNQARKGIFMNPAVRVGYERRSESTGVTSYQEVHTGAKGLGWLTPSDYIWGIWGNRVRSWLVPAWWDRGIVRNKLKKWQKEGKAVSEQRHEVGDFCIIDEMHILIWNGWKHV